ncbi:zinc finger BED domain-containing protein RICESLEEPER 1-like [Carica papaya]|uniref:zinc finger BED domain-containing protein RICESLEEPER 1-like n=1 Tax=Carica papaya TaxID=3649 RepID=UPI000B8D00FB|nr:zinc finger BED domain-containing protein RICESLEEPER 1-like [Carica papaya]
MDPRFKMKLIEFSFSKIYGEDAGMWIKIIDDNVHELFYEYSTPALPPPETFVGGGNEIVPKTETLEGASQESHNIDVSSQDVTLISVGDGLSDFEVYISEITSTQQMKSELDQYLEESLLPRAQEFDILGWWKLNRIKYPILSRMASDILSIPFSTLAPDSLFDTKNKMMDSYRGSLRPVTLEALICAKDWFQYASSTSQVQSETLKPDFKV